MHGLETAHTPGYKATRYQKDIGVSADDRYEGLAKMMHSLIDLVLGIVYAYPEAHQETYFAIEKTCYLQ
jgi:hypothetical protein